MAHHRSKRNKVDLALRVLDEVAARRHHQSHRGHRGYSAGGPFGYAPRHHRRKSKLRRVLRALID